MRHNERILQIVVNDCQIKNREKADAVRLYKIVKNYLYIETQQLLNLTHKPIRMKISDTLMEQTGSTITVLLWRNS